MATIITSTSADNASSEQELEEIIKLAQQGDSQSFEQLIRQYLPFISREVSKLCPSYALEDVSQEILIRTFKALPRYKHNGSFRWWLKKIASRACLDFWRHTRKGEHAIKELASKTFEVDHKSEENRIIIADLERFLSALSAKNRVIFTLAFLDDCSHREIADLLGISLAAIKVRCFRLKKQAMDSFIYE